MLTCMADWRAIHGAWTTNRWNVRKNTTHLVDSWNSCDPVKQKQWLMTGSVVLCLCKQMLSKSMFCNSLGSRTSSQTSLLVAASIPFQPSQFPSPSIILHLTEGPVQTSSYHLHISKITNLITISSTSISILKDQRAIFHIQNILHRSLNNYLSNVPVPALAWRKWGKNLS